jgi:hypothetical protein
MKKLHEVVEFHGTRSACRFWATHNGAEIDLVLERKGRRTGVECKRADAPRLTPSMRAAARELELDELLVASPGSRKFELADRVTAVPLVELVG